MVNHELLRTIYPLISNTPTEVLLLHYHATNLCIHELTLLKLPILTNGINLHQVESLYKSLNSIDSWFAIFFTIPHSDYLVLPFSIFSQIVHCLIILYKLSTLEDPAWNLAAVRKTIDILVVLDEVVRGFTQASAVSSLNGNGDGNGDDLFLGLAKRLGSLRLVWEVKLGGGGVGARNESVAGTAAPLLNETMMDENQEAKPFYSEWMGDDWLTDMFSVEVSQQ